ncbi:hypothetical protein HAX54_036868 [Datura stramonium]|uniref:Cytochrome P450 n=1 Tax=Datura stramonium TaxID=4076 RepID=A0ABS8VJ14_DATST|nr:hypothetical protein [Datura stramonium]
MITTQLLPPSGPHDQISQLLFDDAVRLSFERLLIPFPFIWKIRRALDIGRKELKRVAVEQVRKFAKEIVRRAGKKQICVEILDSTNGQPDEEDFVMDNAISFILAGRDTISAALTCEGVQYYDEVRSKMMYTQASLAETMRLYPPVPEDIREATEDDILPDGTFVKKGTRVIYHPYAMGRVEKVWGKDWAEFRPERWLNGHSDKELDICGQRCIYISSVSSRAKNMLGKEMAFLQMKVGGCYFAEIQGRPVVEQGVSNQFHIKY